MRLIENHYIEVEEVSYNLSTSLTLLTLPLTSSTSI